VSEAGTGRIYSVGYEGLDVPGLLERLLQSRVELVVDVRFNASSRKRGFSRGPLKAALEAAGIAYLHEPLLGNPPDNRAPFRTGDFETGRQRLRERLSLMDDSAAALERLVELAQNRRIAVLCLENDQSRCHRQVVIDMAREAAPELETLPLY
jgi:uncharacterized protein (DUF488 family)